jgi:hypothetical protein
MKASLVAYDFRELHKNLDLKNSNNQVCKGLSKMAKDPILVA